MSGIIYHVYRRPAPGGIEMPEGHRAVWYGVKITGRPCSLAILHDAPKDAGDQRWLDTELYVRMSPGALTIHAWWEAEPVPADLDAREAQAREVVEQ